MKLKLISVGLLALGCIAVIVATRPIKTEEPKPIGQEITSPVEPIQETFTEAIEIIEPVAYEPQIEPQETTDEPESIWSETDKLMLAKMTMAEAEGESLEGKCLVVRVILNRVESEIFPSTVYEVLSQKTQFSSWTNGRYENAVPSDEVWQAVEMVCDDGWDESGGALFFEATYCQNTWQSNNRVYLFTVGGHKFYL